MFDSRREPEVYAQLLPLAPVGPPRYLGSVVSGPRGEGRWLFLEWVQGRPLQEVGERPLWSAAARWLAEMQVALAVDLERNVAIAQLRKHDVAYCRLWPRRARQFAQAAGHSTSAVRFLTRLDERYEAMIEELLEMPHSVLHGDFHAANVLVASGSRAVQDEAMEKARIAPVDWEMAAAGPGLLDLAALISGNWADAERERIVAAYASAHQAPRFTIRQLELARLHHAVQRLGWVPPGWEPPASQRHDWLGEAIELAERLSL